MSAPHASDQLWTCFGRADQIHRNARFVMAIRGTSDDRILANDVAPQHHVSASGAHHKDIVLLSDRMRS